MVSAYGDDVSVAANGYLADNDLNELVEVYMADLVGDHVYEQYGNLFPLLIKTIDAQEKLSMQVHPNDEVALDKHGALGKDEMWYVTHCEPDAKMVLGFNQDTSREMVKAHLEAGTFESLINEVIVKQGDAIALPAGLLHTIYGGIQVIEIQETSDLTYRLYDYNRSGLDGKQRQLHVNEALDVLNYKHNKQPIVDYEHKETGVVNLVQNSHFTANLLTFCHPIGRNYFLLDSFVIYICAQGSAWLLADNYMENGQPLLLNKGEAILLPATTEDVVLTPNGNDVQIIETYIP